MSTFTIIVDSSCDLPSEYIEEHGIEVVPMPYELDGVSHDQGYWQKIAGKEYYDALRKGGVATTSQVNPYTFSELFKKFVEQDRAALFLLVSSSLSNTFESAQTALKEVKEAYPEAEIYLVDAINASVGHGLLTTLTVKKRNEGLSAAETAAWLDEKKNSCMGVFTVDDLMYLHRGGRLSKLSAVAGSVLGIKPVLNLAPDGTLALKDKARKKKGAMALMASQLKRSIREDTELDTVFIAHTDCPEDARVFAELIKNTVKVREVVVMLMGPIIGAHLGPGSLVLLFEADMTREEYESRFYRSKK